MQRIIVPGDIKKQPSSNEVIRLLSQEGNLYKLNLHSHSTLTDGHFTPEELNAPTSIGIKNVETRIGLWNRDVQLFIQRVKDVSVQVLVIPLKE